MNPLQPSQISQIIYSIMFAEDTADQANLQIDDNNEIQFHIMQKCLIFHVALLNES